MGPTQGAVEAESRWDGRPVAALLVRVLVVLIPFLVAWTAVYLLADRFVRPDGLAGLGLWLGQAAAVSLLVSLAAERVTRRALPLAVLLNMTLVFPDQAPSRFGTALRSGTIGRLQERVNAVNSEGLGADDAAAAARAVQLISLLSQHDRLTRGHTERVRAYSDLIAEEMGVSPGDRDRLAWGAMLHDIGKLTVPPEILNKQTRPNDEEWAVLQGHPAASAALLAPLQDWLGEWGRAAAEHHERWDGAGYPSGLAGTDISLAGRITAVADAYDVITSRRSYKPAMSPEAAREELIRCAGTQFDPEVVRAFLNVSLGRRWVTGPLAWLLELPGVMNVGSNLPAVANVVAGAAVVAGSVILPIATDPPDELAYRVDATGGVTVIPSTDIPPGTEAQPTDGPAEETTTTVAADSETAPITAPTPGSTVPEETTTSSDVGSDATDGPDETPPVPGEPISTTTLVTTASTSPSTSSPAGGGSPTTTTTAPTTTAPTTTTTQATTTTATTTTTVPTTTTTVPTTTTTTVPPGTPMAVDDWVTVEEKKDERIFVLTNDDEGSAPFDEATLTIIVPPSHADEYRVHDDHIHYKSETYEGQDSLQYRICNDDGLCDTATLTITVVS